MQGLEMSRYWAAKLHRGILHSQKTLIKLITEIQKRAMTDKSAGYFFIFDIDGLLSQEIRKCTPGN